jgi:hypothetical protein
MTLDPQFLSFGNVPVGLDSVRDLWIQNTGGSPLFITGFVIPAGFSVLSTLPLVVYSGSNARERVIVQFSPAAEREYSDSLLIINNSSDSVVCIQLQGFGVAPSSVEANFREISSDFYLGQNFPNPFNASTTIVYGLPKAEFSTLQVFDVIGHRVAVLKDDFLEAGTHRVTFDGSSLASGIYFARLNAGQFSQTKKLVILK